MSVLQKEANRTVGLRIEGHINLFNDNAGRVSWQERVGINYYIAKYIEKTRSYLLDSG
jgi:hypothetical protein